MTGIEMIAKERQEQIEKHGYTLKVDQEKWYLPILAQYCLLHENDAEKESLEGFLLKGGINPTFFEKIKSKTELEKLVIAGALLAAELDRINQ